MNWLLRMLGRKGRLAVPAFGGDVRSPVRGPGSIRASLARLSFVRSFLTSICIVLSLAVALLAFLTPSAMDTQLFISDGSAFGCFVPDHLPEAQP